MTRPKALRRAVGARVLPVFAGLGACLTAGCYQLVPLDAAPASAGRTVVLELTDQGRVALVSSVGPGVRTMTGSLVSMSETHVVLRLSQVVDLNNIPQTWAGESLSVERRHLARAIERRPDRVRTALLAGAVSAVVIGFFANRSLFGQGVDPVTPPGAPPPNDQ